MKNLKIVLPILLLTTISFSSIAQQPTVLASAETEKDKQKKASEKKETVEEPTSKKEEDEEPGFTFSGSVDAYFHSPFKVENPYGMYGPSSSFANLKGFSLGMVNLIASYDGEKSGFVADIVFGPRGQEAVFGNPSTGQRIINQAFAYYKFSDKVTLNLGQFNTFLGYEVISPTLNFHYSTSYLFSYGPFSHSGARLDFAFENGMVAKLAVMNPTDLVEFNPVNTYTLGAQIGKSTDAGGVWLNFLYGDQDGTLEEGVAYSETSAGKLFQADITLGYNLSDAFYLGFNASMQSTAVGEESDINGDIIDSTGDPSSFLGFAVYPKITLSESFGLGLRAEYFSVKNNHLDIFGLDGNGDGSVMAFTLSGNYKVGGLTFIPEVRIDKTSEDSFIKLKDGVAEAKNLMPSLTLAAVYKF
jgi:hypothetical protein